MLQVQTVATLVLLFAGCACARHSGTRARGFLTASAELQPQKVAMTLARVEGEWKSQAAVAAECSIAATGDATHCVGARQAFLKSCSTVVSAVVKASSGNRAAVKEYMGDVCRQGVLDAWQKERCSTFAAAI